jgi:hypothetical protein
MATILTPPEIKLYGTLGAQVDTTSGAPLISVCEEQLFRQYFGEEFYEELLADLFVPPTTPVPYASGTSYALNDYVYLNDITYKVIQATNGTQRPGQGIGYFQPIPKFETLANQELFVRYLSFILANQVATEMTVPLSIRFEDNGASRAKGEHFQPATAGELAQLKKNNYSVIKVAIDNMEAFIMRNKADYPNYRRVLHGCTNTSESTGGDYRRNDTVGIMLPPKGSDYYNDYDYDDSYWRR